MNIKTKIILFLFFLQISIFELTNSKIRTEKEKTQKLQKIKQSKIPSKKKRKQIYRKLNKKLKKNNKKNINEIAFKLISVINNNNDTINIKKQEIKKILINYINNIYENDFLLNFIKKKDKTQKLNFEEIFENIINEINNSNDLKIKLNLSTEEKIENILTYDKETEEISLLHNNKKEIIFNKNEINELMKEFENKEENKKAQIIISEIEQKDIEKNKYIVKEGAIIEKNNNEQVLLSKEDISNIFNGINESLKINGNDFLINLSEIKYKALQEKLNQIIKEDQKVSNENFMEHIIGAIKYFSSYCLGELNLFYIIYLITPNLFEIKNDNVFLKNDTKPDSELVLKKFFFDDTEKQFQFTKIINIIKENIKKYPNYNYTPENCKKIGESILKLFSEYDKKPFDIKMIIYYYTIFIIYYLSLQEKLNQGNNNFIFNKDIYKICDKLLPNNSSLYQKYKNDINTESQVFKDNSILDIFKMKNFFLEDSLIQEKDNIIDIKTDKIYLLNNEFNIKLWILQSQLLEVYFAEKNETHSDLINDNMNICELVISKKFIKKEKQIKENKMKIIEKIKENYEQLLMSVHNSEPKAKFNENYKTIQEILIKGKKSEKLILLQKNNNNKKEDNKIKIDFIDDCFKLSRHLRNALELLISYNKLKIYEKELEYLFNPNEFFNILFTLYYSKEHIDQYNRLIKDIDKNKIKETLNNYYKETIKKIEKEDQEDIKKKMTELLNKEKEAFEIFNEIIKNKIGDSKKIELEDLTNKKLIEAFLINITKNQNTSLFYDIDRVYGLIVQATNAQFIIKDLFENIKSDKGEEIKEPLKIINSLNKLYIQFLFNELSERVIFHNNIENIEKSLFTTMKEFAYKSFLYGTALSGLGALWYTGALSSIGESIADSAMIKGIGNAIANNQGASIALTSIAAGAGLAYIASSPIKKAMGNLWEYIAGKFKPTNSQTQEDSIFV